jgi:hypothetical protein
MKDGTRLSTESFSEIKTGGIAGGACVLVIATVLIVVIVLRTEKDSEVQFATVSDEVLLK